MSTISRITLTGCALGATLWMSTAAAIDAAGARPGDEAMTCEQIASELMPYMHQIVPNMQAVIGTNQQLMDQAMPMAQKRRAENEALSSLAMAGAIDPTGASKRAYQAAVMAQAAKERAENEALANSPTAQKYKAQTEQLADQAKQLQSDARLQRLMQLGQQKHCDRK